MICLFFFKIGFIVEFWNCLYMIYKIFVNKEKVESICYFMVYINWVRIEFVCGIVIGNKKYLRILNVKVKIILVKFL